MTELLLVLCGLAIGGLLAIVILRARGGKAGVQIEVRGAMVADRVRAVGRLVGFEVHAKEIATSTKGWSWVPPLILSQARLAMIFTFEKQYAVDLTRLTDDDVEIMGPGRYRITLPELEGLLRLTDVQPYDIQAGRILGLLDVIQMDAQTQGKLMDAAQEQAATLYDKHEGRYMTEARRSIERQVESLMRLVGVEAVVQWRDADNTETPVREKIDTGPALARHMVKQTA